MTVERAHQYVTTVTWTGDDGAGTADYRAYRRDHLIEAAGKPPLPGSSDPAFRGDPGRYNPEELLVASLSACHMLWYLHLCAVNGVVVTAYQDRATGTMAERPDGSGSFTSVVLAPRVEITPESDPARAMALHADAHRMCFVANSVSFPVSHRPELVLSETSANGAHCSNREMEATRTAPKS
jgi:organic hydroperoxide reductase OsmC/OhrA